jgi:hypothetical protein
LGRSSDEPDSPGTSEATGGVIDDKTRELLAALLAYPDVKTGSRPGGDRTRQTTLNHETKIAAAIGAAPILPMIPISFRKSETVLNYFSLVTTVGTPQTVAAQELRIESMFPADEETEQEHLRLLGIVSA